MDALVMCGGRGTRLDAPVEKPLFEIDGCAMVDRVIDALQATPRVDGVHAAVSPATPDTRAHFAEDRPHDTDDRTRGEDVTVVDTPGHGYVADLDAALDDVGRPAVVVAADLPLLAPEHVERALEARSTALAGDSAAETASGPSVTVCVPVALKECLGASIDTTMDGLAPTGLNVVDATEDIMYTSYDARLAVNVNRPADATLASDLLGGNR